MSGSIVNNDITDNIMKGVSYGQSCDVDSDAEAAYVGLVENQFGDLGILVATANTLLSRQGVALTLPDPGASMSRMAAITPALGSRFWTDVEYLMPSLPGAFQRANLALENVNTDSGEAPKALLIEARLAIQVAARIVDVLHGACPTQIVPGTANSSGRATISTPCPLSYWLRFTQTVLDLIDTALQALILTKESRARCM